MRQASARGHLGALISYERMGARLDSQGGFGESALMLAAELGHVECVKWLAERSDLSLQDSMGRCAMALACGAGQAECAAILAQAARSRGESPWGVDTMGRGPLMAAAARGSLEGAEAARDACGLGGVDALGLDAAEVALGSGWPELAARLRSWMDEEALAREAQLAPSDSEAGLAKRL